MGEKIVIPDFRTLVDEVVGTGTGAASWLHGDNHWRAVAWAGLQVAKESEGVDPVVVLLFSLFHDSMRLNDGEDPQHGRRGGAFARELHQRVHFLTDIQMHKLQTACNDHTNGLVSADLTIGACWDADRLNLWRVTITPIPRLMSTPAAAHPERIAWAKALEGERIPWPEIWVEYQSLLD